MTDRQAGVEEVPQGYKLTEVGVIPEDWVVKSIGDLIAEKGGSSKTGPFGTLLKASEYSTEGVPIVSVGEVGFGKIEVKESTPMAPPSVVKRLSEYCLKPGDIVFGRKGAVERSAIVETHQEGWFLGSDGIRLRLPPSVHPPFIAHQLQSPRICKWLISNAIGTTMASLNQDVLSQITLSLAPLPEQRAIAAALSDADGLIGALDALIEKKRAIKQAAMQQLLTGKKRLPGFSGEWRATTLGETADIKNGATPSTQIPAYWNGQIPWCTPTDITGTPGKYLLTTERSITVEGLENCAASLLPVGALLLCSRATIGEIKIAASPVCTNQGFKSLVCKSGISNEFLYYLLLTLKPQMIERAIGSTFLEIGKPDVASIKLRTPEYSEQHAIAAVLSDMDAEIAALERRREKAEQIKQGMMQQLLTGRIRLVEPPEAGTVA